MRIPIIDFAKNGSIPEVCVVGAGPVGISIASEIARRGRNVLLLESGLEKPTDHRQRLNYSISMGQTHHGHSLGRHRVLGGGSRAWGGQILPFSEIDFRSREWVPGSGWPISHQQIVNYYAKALCAEGLSEAVSDAEIVSNLGIESSPFGSEIELHFSRWCPEPDFSRLYEADLNESTFLKYVLGATVIEIKSGDGEVESLKVIDEEGGAHSIRASTYVFAQGTIETVRLMLYSRRKNPNAGWLNNPMIGKCFMDHPTYECASIYPFRKSRFHNIMDVGFFKGLKYQPRMRLQESRQEQLGVLNVGGIISFKTDLDELALRQVKLAARKIIGRHLNAASMVDLIRNAPKVAPYFFRQTMRYLIKGRSYNPADGGYRLLVFSEQAPNSGSELILLDQVDENGVPGVGVRWQMGALEAKTVRAFVQEVVQAFEGEGLGKVEPDHWLDADDQTVLNHCWDNFHHMGGMKMAQSAADGVVDRNLKVFGCSNAYACGCAVFPTGGMSNPTHTAIALGLRLAEYIDNNFSEIV